MPYWGRKVIDPRLKIVLLLMAGTLAVTLNTIASLLTLTLASGACLLVSGLTNPWKKRGAVIVVAIIWSTVLSQSLFYGQQPRTPLLSFGPVVFWSEGLAHGLAQSLRFVGLTLAGIALAISTSPDRLLVAMQKLGMPSGLCFLTVTALRFMPTVGREMLTIRQARRMRSGKRALMNPLDWLKVEIRLLMPALARSLRRARALGESMHVRGFDPATSRRTRRQLNWARKDTLILLCATVLLLATLSTKALFFLYTTDLYYQPALRRVYGLCRDWL